MEVCTKEVSPTRHCGSYAINEHRGSGRCDRCWQEDRAEDAEARVAELEHIANDAADMNHKQARRFHDCEVERDRYREALEAVSSGHDTICCCVCCNALRND